LVRDLAPRRRRSDRVGSMAVANVATDAWLPHDTP